MPLQRSQLQLLLRQGITITNPLQGHKHKSLRRIYVSQKEKRFSLSRRLRQAYVQVFRVEASEKLLIATTTP
jgi:hypothetical protein